MYSEGTPWWIWVNLDGLDLFVENWSSPKQALISATASHLFLSAYLFLTEVLGYDTLFSSWAWSCSGPEH